MNDGLELALGPLLALIPVFVWELWVKPLRTRRNLALLLLAEVRVNLEEIAYYRVCRSADHAAFLVNLSLPRSAYSSVSSDLAELPTVGVEDAIRFYGLTAKIESTVAAIDALRVRREAALHAEREMDRDVDRGIDDGLRALDTLLNQAFQTGVRARTGLHQALRDSWFDEPAPLESANCLMENATKEYRIRQSRLAGAA